MFRPSRPAGLHPAQPEICIEQPTLPGSRGFILKLPLGLELFTAVLALMSEMSPRNLEKTTCTEGFITASRRRSRPVFCS